jgi:hypothetical protein
MSPEIINAEARNPFRRSSLIVRSKMPLCVDPTFSLEPKKTLVLSPVNRPQTEMVFVQKNTYQITADETLEIWHKLKDAGLPVVPTMRKVNGHSVLMTNLTVDGSYLFGKYAAFSDTAWTPKDMTKKFKKIKSIEIMRKVWDLAGTCNENDIELAYDDAFEVLVRPDGSWKLVILDLGWVDIEPEKEKELLEEANSKHCNYLLQVLDILRDRF